MHTQIVILALKKTKINGVVGGGDLRHQMKNKY